MDGEAGWWTTSGNIGLPPLARVIGVGRQHTQQLLEFVFESVYVDLQYDEISLTLTGGSVCLCGVCSPVVVIGQSVRLSWYPMLWVRLLRWL